MEDIRFDLHITVDANKLMDIVKTLFEAIQGEKSTEGFKPTTSETAEPKPKKKPPVQDKAADEPPWNETTEKNSQSTLTVEDVRAVLADKTRQGYSAEVKEILKKHGSEKLSGIDPAEYEAIIAEAEVIGNAK